MALSAAGLALAESPTFTVSPTEPMVGDTVTFEATSVDCAVVTCTWSGDVSGTVQSVQAVYSVAGSYSATLRADNGADPAESSTQSFTVVANGEPTVDLTYAPALPVIDQTVPSLRPPPILTGTSSTTPGGSSSMARSSESKVRRARC